MTAIRSPYLSVFLLTASLAWGLGFRDAAAQTPAFDVVIARGRVMDPASGLDRAPMWVGVRGDSIAAISDTALAGRTVIDAAGQVVAPGFIDVLSYSPNTYGIWRKLEDGVTTNLAMHGALADMGAWYRVFGRSRWPINYGGAFSNPNARERLGISRYRAATAAELARLVALAERAMKDGALGVAMSPEYTPGMTTDEVLAMARVAAAAHAPVFFHARYSDTIPPGTDAEGIHEVLETARRTGAAVHVDHITSAATFDMAAALDSITRARAAGLVVTACVYPYDYWATNLNKARFDAGWQQRFGIGYGDLQIAGTTERLTAASFARYRAQGKLAVAYAIPDTAVVQALRAPFVMIGSDAILNPGNNNHPRASGAFSRLLAVYVRERGTISLMEAIRKMTLLPAQALETRSPAMRRKGRVAVGADADLVVFDPAEVRDRSTVEHPELPSVGISWVLVAGRIALDPHGPRVQERAGRAIRGE